MSLLILGSLFIYKYVTRSHTHKIDLYPSSGVISGVICNEKAIFPEKIIAV